MGINWRNPLHRYVPREVPGPGTGNFAFLPFQSLPAYSVQGPGIIFGGGTSGFDVLQPFPQMYVSQAAKIDGQNGQVYGGVYSQGLIDMDKYIKDQAA